MEQEVGRVGGREREEGGKGGERSRVRGKSQKELERIGNEHPLTNEKKAF